MKIEIAKPERFSQSGKSLLKLIQNNDMPTLDLLVRESVQNSLDAWNKESRSVSVSFQSGNFESSVLAELLEGITISLNKRYGKSVQKYLAVSDSNTQGLTGDIADPNGENGNLQKLIYQICQAQEGEGAGGSWGIGKTVYFRVGIGLVIYYSRISLGNGKYEERMAASLVEDETKPNALIPQYKNYKKRGVAWWGEKVAENLTVPITNHAEIKLILEIFGLTPFTGDSTGTTIIIPYIDEERLLANNIMEYRDVMGNAIMPNWCKSIETYIRVAIQKWYMPRLNNLHYSYGPFLRATVNGQLLGGVDPMDNTIEPLFQLVQALYNRAAVGGKVYEDIASSQEVFIEDVSIRNSLLDSKAGSVAFAKVDKTVMKQVPPYNKFHPLMYINKEYVPLDVNRPIICYCRKPGMIVSYETVSEWTDGIPSADNDHYIVGVFVLNSNNKLSDNLTGIKLEEYVRQSELADHTSWTDINIKNNNPRIVGRIKKHVSSKIAKVYLEAEIEEKTSVNSGYSRFFGDMLLPPENFGKAPSAKKHDAEKKEVVQHKDVTLTIQTDKTIYKKDRISIPFELKTRMSVSKVCLSVLIIASDAGGTLSVDEWLDSVGADVPFVLEGADFSMTKWDSERFCNEFCHINGEDPVGKFKAFTWELTKTPSGHPYGIKLSSEKTHSFVFKGNLNIGVKTAGCKVTIGVITERSES